MKTVHIPTADRRKIEGTIVPAGRPRKHPAALFFHGWGSNRKKHLMPSELLSERGFVCLAVDLRGHGKTSQLEKAVTARDNLTDALAAYDYLASQKDVDDKRIVVAGYSYGGFLAILLAAERNVRWLALRSPALYRDEDLDIPKAKIKRRGLMQFRKRKLSPSDSAVLRAAGKIKADILLIEAEHDRLVPAQQVRNYLKAFRNAKSVEHRVIQGATHAMSPKHFRAAVDAFMDWVERK